LFIRKGGIGLPGGTLAEKKEGRNSAKGRSGWTYAVLPSAKGRWKDKGGRGSLPTEGGKGGRGCVGRKMRGVMAISPSAKRKADLAHSAG